VNRTNKIIVAFLLTVIAGYLVIAGGYLTWAISTDYQDREGSTGMDVIFLIAPMCALALGALAAFMTARRTQPVA
jgi:hypothetical protein